MVNPSRVGRTTGSRPWPRRIRKVPRSPIRRHGTITRDRAPAPGKARRRGKSFWSCVVIGARYSRRAPPVNRGRVHAAPDAAKHSERGRAATATVRTACSPATASPDRAANRKPAATDSPARESATTNRLSYGCCPAPYAVPQYACRGFRGHSTLVDQARRGSQSDDDTAMRRIEMAKELATDANQARARGEQMGGETSRKSSRAAATWSKLSGYPLGCGGQSLDPDAVSLEECGPDAANRAGMPQKQHSVKQRAPIAAATRYYLEPFNARPVKYMPFNNSEHPLARHLFHSANE